MSFTRWQTAKDAYLQAVQNTKRYDEPGASGEWSIRAVTAQLAGWHREAYHRMATEENPADYDVAAFNASSVSAVSLLNWREILDTLRFTFEDLEALVAQRQSAAQDRWFTRLAQDLENRTQEINNWLQGDVL